MSVELLEAVATVGLALGAFAGGGLVGASRALRTMIRSVIREEVTKAVREAVEPIRRDVARHDNDVRELRAAHVR
jgi:hypothetical protein